jgi:hypothetical protein
VVELYNRVEVVGAVQPTPPRTSRRIATPKQKLEAFADCQPQSAQKQAESRQALAVMEEVPEAGDH